MVLSWRGAGLVVLLMLPAVLVIALLVSVNVLGRDFTKTHFRSLVIGGTVFSGLLCQILGRWLNRHKVLRVEGGRARESGSLPDGYHAMWEIPVQHWCWIYLALAIAFHFLWR